MTMQDNKSLGFYADGCVAWDASGRIVICDAWSKAESMIPRKRCEDWRGHLITPGFVDCHVHLPQLDCRNKSGLPLLDWLQTYIYPAEAQFSDAVLARDVAERFFRELLSHGTTTAMIYSSIHEEATEIAFQEADRVGIRAIIGKVMMDQNCPEALKEETTESLKRSERLILKWHGHHNRLFYAMTPRFAVTCSRELIRSAGQMAREHHTYFQTHFAETPDEVALAKEIHPITDYVGFYGDCRCLGEKSMYAHCIYPTDTEWQQLALSRSAVAHCPSSNLFLKSGRMPYEKISEFSIRCGLGSDVGAGPEFSLWDVVRSGQSQHPAALFTDREGFYLATLGGAEALGFASQIGSLQVGKQADIAVFKGTSLPTAIHNPPVAAATYIQGQRWVPGE
jgi:guanine deaminase